MSRFANLSRQPTPGVHFCARTRDSRSVSASKACGPAPVTPDVRQLHSMFIRKPIIIFFVATTLLLLAFGWYKIFTTRVDTVRYYHGLCNSGVGAPYADFTHRLRLL